VQIDLNADVGEGAGQDEALIPLVSSVNVACGAHAGDEATIRRTIELAQAHDVAVGAHPGYPDRAGFGRRPMALETAELRSSIVDQVRFVLSIARDLGQRLGHVKPHGSLYNRAARDRGLAELVAGAVEDVSPELTLVGLAGSQSLRAARAISLPVAAEAFADRAYEVDGSLRSRDLPGAVHSDPAQAAQQALSIVRDHRVRAWDGSWLAVEADTLCIHGDSPGAVDMARAVRKALEQAGIEVRPVASGRAGPVPADRSS
jgi:5-oxoprolinase (ATP-hydrolysing) subunit A